MASITVAFRVKRFSIPITDYTTRWFHFQALLDAAPAQLTRKDWPPP